MNDPEPSRWSDFFGASELVEVLRLHAAQSRRRGMDGLADDLGYAADCLAEHVDKVEIAKRAMRETLNRFDSYIAEMRKSAWYPPLKGGQIDPPEPIPVNLPEWTRD